MRYAIVETSTDKVLNVIELEEGAQYTPPAGCKLVQGRDFPSPPAQPAPMPPTLDEIYDRMIQGDKVFKALVLAINDGSLTVGGNKTGAQLKAIIKAKM